MNVVIIFVWVVWKWKNEEWKKEIMHKICNNSVLICEKCIRMPCNWFLICISAMTTPTLIILMSVMYKVKKHKGTLKHNHKRWNTSLDNMMSFAHASNASHWLSVFEFNLCVSVLVIQFSLHTNIFCCFSIFFNKFDVHWTVKLQTFSQRVYLE